MRINEPHSSSADVVPVPQGTGTIAVRDPVAPLFHGTISTARPLNRLVRKERETRHRFVGREPRPFGHEPAGAVTRLLLMVALASVCSTRSRMGLDAFWSEAWHRERHGALASGILGLALVHAAAALVESRRRRENWVLSIVTGRERA